jgi:hypothetical protein
LLPRRIDIRLALNPAVSNISGLGKNDGRLDEIISEGGRSPKNWRSLGVCERYAACEELKEAIEKRDETDVPERGEVDGF